MRETASVNSAPAFAETFSAEMPISPAANTGLNANADAAIAIARIPAIVLFVFIVFLLLSRMRVLAMAAYLSR